MKASASGGETEEMKMTKKRTYASMKHAQKKVSKEENERREREEKLKKADSLLLQLARLNIAAWQWRGVS
jgi:hypothetical protein